MLVRHASKTTEEDAVKVKVKTSPQCLSSRRPSLSPVSCHAAGFYPDKAEMFWRKDGEQLHEDVDHGEILPNHDGTFQMRVDPNLSSVTAGDWSSQRPSISELLSAALGSFRV
ncbi:major histocompatibility complex class I-related gene protein-like [Mastacembelus armatus]|uniref:major histocompatibility complex class I-related gene protein-like n=1 Tax=Mastacembelus armatus TaxID=205130 RepID=UPI000E45B510|nr:major histocompatibility complex class I-related gene protein-like [Mastacembelus armatus]